MKYVYILESLDSLHFYVGDYGRPARTTCEA